MDTSRIFTERELLAIEEDARGGLLREGDTHWLPLVLDLSRALRREMDSRVHGPTRVIATNSSTAYVYF